MGIDESMSSNNCSNEQIIKEIREVKELLVQVLKQGNSREKTGRTYKNSAAAKERALQIGRRMLIMSPGAEGIPSVRELAEAMGVSTASLYKQKTSKGDPNPYHTIIVHRNMLIETYASPATSASLKKGFDSFKETGSGESIRSVDGVHYDDEIEDF